MNFPTVLRLLHNHQDDVSTSALSTRQGILHTFSFAGVGHGKGGLEGTTGAVEASVSISNSSCDVTVELALFLAPSPTF